MTLTENKQRVFINPKPSPASGFLLHRDSYDQSKQVLWPILFLFLIQSFFPLQTLPFCFFTDANGNVLTANNPNASMGYQYDALNRVFQSDAAYTGATTRTTQYSWDFDGNPDQVQCPSTAVIDFNFDAQNRNNQLTAHNAIVSDMSFDAGSRLTSRTLNTGIVCSYAWDKLNRPLQSSDQALTLQWNFDLEGNRLFERKAFGATSTADHYLYDNLYQVTGTKYGVTSPLTTGTISEANQPTAPAYSAVTGTKNQSTTLDKEHNRVSQTTDASTTNYTHDNRNRYTNVGAASLTWDDNGNLLSDGTQKYVWDFENRLLEVRTQANALIVSYLYDAQGKRIAKLFPNGTKRYYYYDPGWNLLAEYNQTGALVRETTNAGMDQYLSATANLSALGINPVDLGYSAGTTSLDVVFHQNTLGNVLALTDTSANVIARYSYDVNGAVSYLNASGAVLTGSALNAVKALNVSLFQGREFDSESGLYAFRNRFFSPTLGRFISTDPLDYVDGMNIYAFVNGNVVNMIDPLGLAELDPKKERLKKGDIAMSTKGGKAVPISAANTAAMETGAVPKFVPGTNEQVPAEIVHTIMIASDPRYKVDKNGGVLDIESKVIHLEKGGIKSQRGSLTGDDAIDFNDYRFFRVGDEKAANEAVENAQGEFDFQERVRNMSNQSPEEQEKIKQEIQDRGQPVTFAQKMITAYVGGLVTNMIPALAEDMSDLKKDAVPEALRISKERIPEFNKAGGKRQMVCSEFAASCYPSVFGKEKTSSLEALPGDVYVASSKYKHQPEPISRAKRNGENS